MHTGNVDWVYGADKVRIGYLICCVVCARMSQITMKVQDGWRKENLGGECMRAYIGSPISYSTVRLSDWRRVAQ